MIEKKIIFNKFYNKDKIKIIDHLNKKYNWKPVFMTGLLKESDVINQVNKNYPSCITSDSMAIRQAQFDYRVIGPVKPIDAEILSSISNHAFNFLGHLSDPTGNNFSYKERSDYYFDILKYYNTVILNLKPDIFVSYVIPHTPVCRSLYYLCKYHYNIDVLFINHTPLLNKKFYVIGSSTDKLYQPFLKNYKFGKNLKIGPDAKSYLESLSKKNAESPNHIFKAHKSYAQSSKLAKRIRILFGIIIRTLKNGYGFKIDGDWKKNNKPYYNIKSRMNNFENFLFMERRRRKNISLKKVYDRHVTSVDFKRKYIYFASQYQPEATTSVLGGYYANFFLVLDILSAVIPDDWIIYYKENSTIFSKSIYAKGSLERDRHYYERLANYKNIKMISENINTFDLIDYAQAVSTVTGTVAWEAVVRGVPSMTFGKTWYSGCDSIFSIKTFKDAEDAIKKIINGYKPDQSDIERYTAAIEKVASKNIIPQKMFNIEIAKHENPDKILINIAEAFYQSYINKNKI